MDLERTKKNFGSFLKIFLILQELDDLLKILEDPGKNCGGNWKILGRILKIKKDIGKNFEDP